MHPEQRSIPALVHAFVLMARITVRISRVTPPTLDGVEYSNLMVRILIALDATGGCTPSELADRLGVARSAISRTLRQLHTRGIVSRRVDTKDMRYVRLRLSAKGRRSLDEFLESVVVAAADIEPLVDELARVLEVDRAELPLREDVTLLELLDALGESGSSAVAELLPLEQSHAVGSATPRFVLLAARDRGSASIDDISALLGIETTRVLAASDQLREVGLVVNPDADRLTSTSVLTLSTDAAALVDAQATTSAPRLLEMLRDLDSLCRSADRVSATER